MRKHELHPAEVTRNLIREIETQNVFYAMRNCFKHSMKIISELASLESQYPDLDLQISLLEEAQQNKNKK